MTQRYVTNRQTKLQLETGSGEWSDVPRLRNVPALQMTEEKIEVTHHQSKNREYIPSGLSDPGDYEYEMETDRSDPVHQQIFALRKSGDIVNWRLIYPDGLAYQFGASVISITRNEADPQSPDVIVDTVGLAICDEIEDISDELLS